MRRVRYHVAMSLDGFIAGPHGEYDWLLADPAIGIAELFSQFDTFLIGRKTFELMVKAGRGTTPGVKTIVFSQTLGPGDYPDVTIVADHVAETVAGLKGEPGKDIWLFGGGELFRSLLNAGLVDTVEVLVEPVLLGGGISLLPAPARRANLKLREHKVYKTGIVSLSYNVE
jgi:dihydrofolate reductase